MSQDVPKPILFDAFGSIVCEDLLGRQDAFFAELANNPSDVGYEIIYTNEKSHRAFVHRLRANFFVRRFDRDRLKFVLAKPKPAQPVSGEFWRVPLGAEPPAYEPADQELPDATRPFIFGMNSSENVCPSFSPDLFAKLIVDNPGSRARLVIYGPTSSWRKSTAVEELELLTQYTELSKDRVEFYFVHRPREAYTETEYWYLPPRTK